MRPLSRRQRLAQRRDDTRSRWNDPDLKIVARADFGYIEVSAAQMSRNSEARIATSSKPTYKTDPSYFWRDADEEQIPEAFATGY